MTPSPIGIFDSGLGGLSVLREIRALMPAESLVYLADSHYAPYGEKPRDFVQARTLQACEWLAGQGCKAIVVACNTATAHGIQTLRDRLALPIVGVEPGLKPAAAMSQSKVVGVLATANTLASDKFARLLASLSDSCRFVCQAGNGLVARIEQGDIDGPLVREALRAYLAPMHDAGADTLVLGCTHYPFLAPTLRELAGDRMTLVDTGVAVARQLQRRLVQEGLIAIADRVGAAPADRYCSTGEPARLQRMLFLLLGVEAAVEAVSIDPAPAPA
ncbi:glutamate racemase [Cupriavidus gilardii J11]|uniref:Glutamate racemase n=1 Tax=Cupriavidus gilardii J11 TaxID=936133 RepID=A0A562BK22_9BURK|nr:glutamate racemase [Cupriavidus gilardii]TWG85441.1 glutamate racemase [Cupriavidus gilardii J11]